MLSVSEMVDVLDFDFDMENGEKVAFDTTSHVVCMMSTFLGCLSL